MNLPETSNQEITPSVDATVTNRLQELTSQSWNLELVISGAALFATLSQPDLLDSGLDYYRYNLMPEGASGVVDRRAFITLGAPKYVANTNAYDNLHAPNQLITGASIQADVIREPYIRLFVGYLKSLDAELTKRFQEPTWPTSLTRKEQRERRAAWYIKAFETYFGGYLTDSLYRSPGFLFMQRADNQQRGSTTVLLTENLKPRRNILRIAVPDSDSATKAYCQIPFWYVPEQ